MFVGDLMEVILNTIGAVNKISCINGNQKQTRCYIITKKLVPYHYLRILAIWLSTNYIPLEKRIVVSVLKIILTSKTIDLFLM